MGIRINAHTWRAPLQIIDSWLPAPTAPTTPVVPRRGLPLILQRFARAGWLGRGRVAANGPMAGLQARCAPPLPSASSRNHPVRLVRGSDRLRNDARMVISGRLSDVCAELDRLALLELQSGKEAA